MVSILKGKNYVSFINPTKDRNVVVGSLDQLVVVGLQCEPNSIELTSVESTGFLTFKERFYDAKHKVVNFVFETKRELIDYYHEDLGHRFYGGRVFLGSLVVSGEGNANISVFLEGYNLEEVRIYQDEMFADSSFKVNCGADVYFHIKSRKPFLDFSIENSNQEFGVKLVCFWLNKVSDGDGFYYVHNYHFKVEKVSSNDYYNKFVGLAGFVNINKIRYKVLACFDPKDKKKTGLKEPNLFGKQSFSSQDIPKKTIKSHYQHSHVGGSNQNHHHNSDYYGNSSYTYQERVYLYKVNLVLTEEKDFSSFPVVVKGGK